MTFPDDIIPDQQGPREFGITETDNPATTSDVGSTDARALAQKRLALKLAASAGLSMALAEVFVMVALGDGRLP